MSLGFDIADNGIGFPDEVRHNLFEWFIQVENSMTGRVSGTVLGLVVCRELVQRMDA